MPGDAHLAAAALRLRAAAPDAWEEFLMAVREYAAIAASEMVSCPPELLLRAQGMAIASHEIMKVLVNAPATHERNQVQRHVRSNHNQRNGF
jgi:hypothetical protein